MRGRVQLDGVNCPPCATRKQFVACLWPFLSWFYDYNEAGITYIRMGRELKGLTEGMCRRGSAQFVIDRDLQQQ